MATHVQPMSSEPVPEIARLWIPVWAHLEELLQTCTHKCAHEVCAAHACEPDVSYCLVPWSLGLTDFPTSLQSWNFKFSSDDPASRNFKKWYRRQWRFSRRNGGRDVTAISSHTPQFGLLSKCLSIQWHVFATGMWTEVICIISESEF